MELNSICLTLSHKQALFLLLFSSLDIGWPSDVKYPESPNPSSHLVLGVPVRHSGRTDTGSHRIQPQRPPLTCAFTTQGLCCQQLLRALWFQSHEYKYFETIVELRLIKEGHDTWKLDWYMPMDITFVMIFYSLWWDCYVLEGIKTKINTKTILCPRVWTYMGSNFFIGQWLLIPFLTVSCCHSLVEWPYVSVPYQARHLFCFL